MGIMCAKLFWYTAAWCQGREYRYRGENRRSPSHKDGSVATIVFLVYLLYPTLCRQAFALLICEQVGDRMYMSMDLQEECFAVGKPHLTYFLLCTIPQILLHVIGIPALGLRAAYRGKSVRVKMRYSISLFRYGMLYSAYNKDRWYWGAIIAFRKAGIAFITSFLSNPSLEVHWAILFLVSSLMANVAGQPHIGVKGIEPDMARSLEVFDTTALFLLIITS